MDVAAHVGLRSYLLAALVEAGGRFTAKAGGLPLLVAGAQAGGEGVISGGLRGRGELAQQVTGVEGEEEGGLGLQQSDGLVIVVSLDETPDGRADGAGLLQGFLDIFSQTLKTNVGVHGGDAHLAGARQPALMVRQAGVVWVGLDQPFHHGGGLVGEQVGLVLAQVGLGLV